MTHVLFCCWPLESASSQVCAFTAPAAMAWGGRAGLDRPVRHLGIVGRPLGHRRSSDDAGGGGSYITDQLPKTPVGSPHPSSRHASSPAASGAVSGAAWDTRSGSPARGHRCCAGDVGWVPRAAAWWRLNGGATCPWLWPRTSSRSVAGYSSRI